MTRAYFASNYHASYYYASYYYGGVVVPEPEEAAPAFTPGGGHVGPGYDEHKRQPPLHRFARDDDYKSSPETTNRVAEALRRAVEAESPKPPPEPEALALAPPAVVAPPRPEPPPPPYVTAIDARLFGGIAPPPGRATSRLDQFDLAHVDLSRREADYDDEEAILLLLLL
ncbi:MAG: hypothetical protein NUW21_04550 [Elusimicrobia bacterium]|nr:hypothetical protein [Elusimicrobiota bacterium]